MTEPLRGPWTVHPAYEAWETNPDGEIRKRKNLTADGRDVGGDDWKKIREFPRYECTIGGDVRNAESHEVLVESDTGTGSLAYTLWKDGKTYKRSWKTLVYATFPELHEGWKDIPDVPGYQVSVDGEMRSKSRWEILPMTSGGSVRVKVNGKRFYVNVADLVKKLFKDN